MKFATPRNQAGSTYQVMTRSTLYPATILALPTIRVPASSDTPITAIIQLTQDRAGTLLSAMRDMSFLATHSSSLFKLSSFETSALYVPNSNLGFTPPENDFVVLPSEFQVAQTIPLQYVHAEVFPSSIYWQASDEAQTFTLRTTEIQAPLLHLITNGAILEPGISSSTLPVTKPRRPMPFLDIAKYREHLH
jgi:hypothetical protein